MQPFLPIRKTDFTGKLVEAFLAANIPLPKVEKLFIDLGQWSFLQRRRWTIVAEKEMFMTMEESTPHDRHTHTTHLPECSVVDKVNQTIERKNAQRKLNIGRKNFLMLLHSVYILLSIMQTIHLKRNVNGFEGNGHMIKRLRKAALWQSYNCSWIVVNQTRSWESTKLVIKLAESIKCTNFECMSRL